MNYRICKNKYGWYKIQKLKEYSFFLIKWKGWIDAAFTRPGNKLKIYSDKSKAKSDIERFIDEDKKAKEKGNKEWKLEEDNV